MNRSLLLLTAVNIFVVFWISCSSKSEYERLVEKELASGQMQNSTLLGITFNMTEEEYIQHCESLVANDKIQYGSSKILYTYQVEETKFPAFMNFYADFKEDALIKLSAALQYQNWTPYTPKLSMDSLVVAALSLYRKEYGADFITIQDSTKGEVYVDIDGNREIRLERANERILNIYFKDLTHYVEK